MDNRGAARFGRPTQVCPSSCRHAVGGTAQRVRRDRDAPCRAREPGADVGHPPGDGCVIEGSSGIRGLDRHDLGGGAPSAAPPTSDRDTARLQAVGSVGRPFGSPIPRIARPGLQVFRRALRPHPACSSTARSVQVLDDHEDQQPEQHQEQRERCGDPEDVVQGPTPSRPRRTLSGEPRVRTSELRPTCGAPRPGQRDPGGSRFVSDPSTTSRKEGSSVRGIACNGNAPIAFEM
jgi:hypothetical protein